MSAHESQRYFPVSTPDAVGFVLRAQREVDRVDPLAVLAGLMVVQATTKLNEIDPDRTPEDVQSRGFSIENEIAQYYTDPEKQAAIRNLFGFLMIGLGLKTITHIRQTGVFDYNAFLSDYNLAIGQTYFSTYGQSRNQPEAVDPTQLDHAMQADPSGASLFSSKFELLPSPLKGFLALSRTYNIVNDRQGGKSPLESYREFACSVLDAFPGISSHDKQTSAAILRQVFPNGNI